MTLSAPFGSLSVAMVTPFSETGEVDRDTAAALAIHLVDRGCDSLVVTGTTGETPTLTDEENIAMFETVVQAVAGRAHVIAGTGTNDTAHSIALSRAAQAADVDGLLLVTPYYNKPSQDGIRAHFEAILEATEIPVMLYDIPGRTGTPIATETILRLAEHERVVALKDAKGDFAATSEVLAKTDLAVYSGDDILTLPLMAAGAVGVVSVSAHVAPERFRRLIDAASVGDFETARREHYQLDPLIRAMMTCVQGAVATKYVLHLQGVLPNSRVRLPLVEPNEAELLLLHAALHQGSIRLENLPTR